MTLDLESAIKHCEEVAEENTKACDRNICFQNEYNNIECDECYIERCNKYASEHRQLAEWLRELKAYRERDFCHYCGERDTLIFDEPCKSCKIYFVRREVNADDNIQS